MSSRAYLIGAIGASTLWASHSILTSIDGLAGERVGVLGEEWTISELHMLRKQGWRFVNHVMLERVDIDHAVLGPADELAPRPSALQDREPAWCLVDLDPHLVAELRWRLVVRPLAHTVGGAATQR